jgi:membrane associated rhomboid family serine protease
VAASDDQPWFPSAHAQKAGVPRDSLDEPLTELRLAGLIRVATWVRGAGQGYVLTPEGAAAARDPAVVEQIWPSLPGLRPAFDSPPDAAEQAPAEPAQSALRPAPVNLRPSVVIPVLVILNLLWFFVGLLLAAQSGVATGDYLVGKDLPTLHRLGAVSGPDLLAGQWWRLLACCFVHVGGLHLLMNMVSLGVVGPLVELVWGRWRLLLIYLLSGLAGSCLAMALRPVNPDTGALVVLAGASGAICGVFAALLAWAILFRSYLPTEVARDLFRRLAVVLVLTIGISFVPLVSWEGHLGGGVAGFVAAGLLNVLRFGDRRRKVLATAALLALPVLCVAGLVVAMESGDSWVRVRAIRQAVRDQATAETYHREVVPLLNAVRPAAVNPVEEEAQLVLVRSVRRRPPNAAAVRAQVEQLRAVAADAAAKLDALSAGSESLARTLAKARAYVDARVTSLDRLLGLLDGADGPAAVDAWVASRRDAERLWEEFQSK